MTLQEALAVVAVRGPEQRRALDVVRQTLARMVTHPLRTHGGELVVIPPTDREDVVQSVLLVVLQRSPLPIVGRPEPVGLAYLAAMLVNTWLNQQRKHRREVLAPSAKGAGDEPRPASSTARPDGNAIEGLLQAARALLDLAYERAWTARRPANRPPLERAWRQIQDTCFGPLSTEDVLGRDESIGPETPEPERIRARDRLYQSHKRARDDVRTAIEALRASGELGADEANQACEALRLLFRCQTGGGSRVSPAGKDRS